MPYVKCKKCHNEFYVKPSHQKIGFGIFCSIACRSESQKKGSEVECHVCKKKVWKSPTDLKRSKSGLYFCSKVCQTKWRNRYFSDEKHSNWKYGESTYRKKLIESGGEIKCVSCGNTDIRVLMAHHMNKDRHDNKIDNLEWLCLNCHHLEHNHKNMVTIV